jgi:hypothetical protein
MRNERLLLGLLPLSVVCGAFGLVASASCGSGSGVNDCFDYTTFKSTTPTVSFKNEVLPIFRNSCGLSDSCHGTPNPPAPAQRYYGPKKSAPTPSATEITAILMNLVGVTSVDEPDMKLIDPGHPETSFMMYKLDGDPQDPSSVNCSRLKCAATQTCLQAMPQSGNTLPAATRDTIRQWIAQGAMDN